MLIRCKNESAIDIWRYGIRGMQVRRQAGNFPMEDGRFDLQAELIAEEAGDYLRQREPIHLEGFQRAVRAFGIRPIIRRAAASSA